MTEPKLIRLLLGDSSQFEQADRLLNAMAITTIGINLAILIDSVLGALELKAISLSVASTLVMVWIYYLGRVKGQKWLIWPFMLCNYVVLQVEFLFVGGGYGVALPLLVAFAGLLPAASRPSQLKPILASLAVFYGVLWLQALYLFDGSSPLSQEALFLKLTEVGIISFGVAGLSLLGTIATRFQRGRISDLNKSLERSNQQLLTALDEVKQLQGILPICANCKQIRDDSGLYHDIEVYISKHTDVDFSHTICAPCQSKLYPELGQ